MNKNGREAEVYFEYHADSASENPCDIRMTAVMSAEEYATTRSRFPVYEEELDARVKAYGGWYCIFMPHLKEYPEIYKELTPFVADNGNLETERFIQALKSRMAAFVEQALGTDKVYIFENVMFQQVLNELLRKMDCDEQQMIAYILEIEQISKVAAERVSDNYLLYPDWLDWMIDYVQQSEYGRRHKVSGRAGLMDYFREWLSIEENCFDRLAADKQEILINHIDYNEQNNYIYSRLFEKGAAR
ncbi:hypothetical protein [Paenibacillus sp. MMS20-IR301]|uniref:hypothetical protein n=1 Tax=Paenibacillus sp. MMS20-IR301 TaxID=2895946 RepID=UPI0028E9FAB8|nr:hypothetical protein [Paenibacillus sp. MMS20-IR301]WNS45814.1 hypothetical protein LOS79_11255 [Paenibacillus sp. MMS20-IR301]